MRKVLLIQMDFAKALLYRKKELLKLRERKISMGTAMVVNLARKKDSPMVEMMVMMKVH